MKKKVLCIHTSNGGLKKGDPAPIEGDIVTVVDFYWARCSNPNCDMVHIFFQLEGYPPEIGYNEARFTNYVEPETAKN